jgi:putative alpha-1,2-mannosidase
MGIYPVTPGSPSYIIGSPLFEEVKIDLGNGNTFEIIAKNNSGKNIYIQGAKLNGKKYTKNWISHKDIVKGGKIVFKMGSTPNKTWGTNKEDLPPSMTKLLKFNQ